MDGWTGFNDELFKSAIVGFEGKARDILVAIVDNYSNFMTSVSEVWASPKAIVFKDWVNSKQYDLENEILKTCNAVMRNAAMAMSTAAAANGKSGTNYVSLYGRVKFSPNHQIGSWGDSKDGMVGMNMKALLEDILPLYEANLQKIIAKVNALPKKIPLYDDANGIRHSYSIRVTQLGDRVNEHITLLKEKINTYITEEVDNVMLAVEKTKSIIESADV